MDFLAAYAATQGDKPAVIDDRPEAPVISWSFAELNRRANRLGALFADAGVTAGTKVVWCGQNSAGLVAGTHALRKLGATGVPLNYRLTPDEAGYVVDNSDAEVVYVDAEYAGLIRATAPATPSVRQVVVFDDPAGEFEARLSAYPDDELGDTSPDSVATAGSSMIYTSGTTGKPKGALRRRVDPEQTGLLIQLIGYTPDDVYLTTGPLYHSGPGGFAAIAQVLGNTVVIQRKFDPEDWLRLVETYRVTTTFTAPTPIRLVCALPDQVKAGYDRSSLKRVIANAAPWTMALKRRYLAEFPPDSLWEVYGSTELGVDTVLAPEDHLRKPGSCGRPAPGIDIKLFDDDGKEVTEPHVNGELYVRSTSVFEAYYKDEAKYDADRRDDYHTVGDIAYFDEDGFYYIADRKNDMIISGGMNIYPAEIEAALDQSPAVFEAAVFGVPSEEWGESVHAVVVPSGPEVTEADVVAHAREHLAGYKVPRSVSFVDEVPKTGSGKVLKRQLRESFWPARAAGSGESARAAESEEPAATE